MGIEGVEDAMSLERFMLARVRVLSGLAEGRTEREIAERLADDVLRRAKPCRGPERPHRLPRRAGVGARVAGESRRVARPAGAGSGDRTLKRVRFVG